MTSAAICFLDLETTGLDPLRHEAWDFYAIRREPDGTERHFGFMTREEDLDLSTADPFALSVGGFYDRHPYSELGRRALPEWTVTKSAREIAKEMSRAVRDAHIIGAVPDFDVAFLKRLFRRHSQPWGGHYHLIDVEALMVGYLRAKAAYAQEPEYKEFVRNLVAPPWGSKEISQACGIDPQGFDEHTARGDVLWARAVYDTVMANNEVPSVLA